MGTRDSLPVTKERPTADERKAAFGVALDEAMRSRAIAPRALGEHIGVSDDAVRKWRDGTNEPVPMTVFAIESHLDLSPGDLSRHLGYLPVTSVGNVAAAIDADPNLAPEARAVVLGAYRAAVKASRSRPDDGGQSDA